MQPKPGNIRESEVEAALGESGYGEPGGFRSGMRERWREQWQWGSVLHVVFLLVLLATPTVTGALWSPIWGVILGVIAALLWLPIGCLSTRGAGWYYFQGGLIGILLQIHYWLSLARQSLPHPG